MKIEDILPKHLDEILSQVGLQKKESIGSLFLPALGVFAAGAVVGGIMGLLLAPQSGRELRSDLEKKLKNLSDEVMQQRDGASPQAPNAHA